MEWNYDEFKTFLGSEEGKEFYRNVYGNIIELLYVDEEFAKLYEKAFEKFMELDETTAFLKYFWEKTNKEQ